MPNGHVDGKGWPLPGSKCATSEVKEVKGRDIGASTPNARRIQIGTAKIAQSARAIKTAQPVK